MMHNSRAVGLRALSLATQKTPSRLRAPQLRSLQSSSEVPPAASQQSNRSLVTEQDAAKGLPKHTPDYTAMSDYRTSTFSPVPTQVMDGSEPGETLPAAVVSGAPIDLQARTVRIYRPTKPATQSGTWHGPPWMMDWDPLAKGHRWENPLMGWQSSADFMQGERLGFGTKEEAIRFAEKQGYQYFVQEPNERKFVLKAYANNFSHSAKPLKIIRTK